MAKSKVNEKCRKVQTINVSSDINKMLKAFKLKNGFKSAEEAIESLLIAHK